MNTTIIKFVLFLTVFCTSLVTLAQDYAEEEISFQSDTTTLYGTLSFPKGDGPYTTIVLVSGSGAQDRTAAVGQFEIFTVLAKALNEQGFAVFRYDERGTGKSGGKSVGMSTTEELSWDAQYAVETIRKRSDINKIGMLGHSDGGIIVPKVASRIEIDFAVLMAGFGVPGYKVTEAQQRAIMSTNPALTDEYINEAVAVNNQVIQLLQNETMSQETISDSVQSLILRSLELLPDNMKATIPNLNQFAQMQASQAIMQFSSPWIRYYMSYDPAPTLKKIQCPVLLLFGAKDTQVTVEQNRAVMEKALEEGGNQHVSVEILENANHLFQRAKTGSPSEYMMLPSEFDTEFIPTITNWIKTQLP